MNYTIKKISFLTPIVSFFFLLFLLPGCVEEIEPCEATTIAGPRVIDYHIDTDEVWEDWNECETAPDYLVTREGWQVKANLTIPAGVIVEFVRNAEAYVFLGGSITANGTADEPIVFRGEEQTPGSWDGILINSENIQNVFNHCIIQHGGKSQSTTFQLPAAGLRVQGEIKLSNTRIESSTSHGLALSNEATLLSFSTNVFNNNTLSAIYMSPKEVHNIDGGTTFGFNGHIGVQVNSAVLNNSLPVTWNKLSGTATYLIEDPVHSNELDIRSDLTLAPGVVLQFGPGGELKAATGQLTAIGNQQEPIIFEGSTRTKGYWDGIFLDGSSNTHTLDHCIIRNGGKDNLGAGITADANIAIWRGAVSMTNCTISDGMACGFAYKSSANATINSDIATSNIFERLDESDVCF